jgi:hypothetical protein
MGIQESFNEHLRVELRKLAEQIDVEMLKKSSCAPPAAACFDLPASICLADHLKQKGELYFRTVLSDVKYDYEAAVARLCGDNARLDVDEVTTNLRKAMLRLRERLLEEIQSWFGGNGRLLETGPEIVECYISCRNGVWWLEEREAKSGKLGVAEEICSRIAYHVILASDVCNLLQEQKVMCLMNLILRR